MRTKLVLRLLDADNRLLGWTEHYAVAKGDGSLRSTTPVVIVADRSGFPACVSIHWCDVHVETRIPCPTGAVSSGDPCPIFTADQPMVSLGSPPAGLPPVSVGSPVAIAVPVGQLGNQGT